MPRKKRRRQIPAITFFVDRCLGAVDVPTSLRAAGERIEIHDDHFPQKTEDALWISKCGRNGWIALSRDVRIRSRELERRAVQSSKVRMFILVSKGLTGEGMSDSLLKALPRIKQTVRKHPPPFIAKVYKDGSVTLWEDFGKGSKKKPVSRSRRKH